MTYRTIITIGLSVALHGGAVLWLQASEPLLRTRTKSDSPPLRFRVLQKPDVVKPAVGKAPKPASFPSPAVKKSNASGAKSRATKVVKARKESGKSQGLRGHGWKRAANGYMALLPEAGVEAEQVQRAFREGQADAATERRLAASARMNGAIARLAELFSSHVSLSPMLKEHLPFRRAAVLLVNHPRQGLYLKGLKGSPILRAKLFGFLQALPTLETWQGIRGYSFAVTLTLRTEQSESSSVRTTIEGGTITHVITTARQSAAAKYFSVSESADGQVKTGVNVLALLEPLLAGDGNEELRRELKALRNSPAFREELRFYRLSN